jgi:hypothetical protein
MLDLLKENVITKVFQSSRLGISSLAIISVAGVFGAVSLWPSLIIGGVATVYTVCKTAENINANKTSNGE